MEPARMTRPKGSADSAETTCPVTKSRNTPGAYRPDTFIPIGIPLGESATGAIAEGTVSLGCEPLKDLTKAQPKSIPERIW